MNVRIHISGWCMHVSVIDFILFIEAGSGFSFALNGIHDHVQHHGLYLCIMPTNVHGNLLILFLGKPMRWLIMEGLHSFLSRCFQVI